MKSRIAVILLLLPLLCSCPDKKDNVIASQPVINSFYMLSNKTKNINQYTFTISEVDHFIQNRDSMPYGTPVDSLSPIIGPQFYSAYIDDTISVYALDTVWVDFSHDRLLKVTAADKTSNATYRIRVNRHQVDPDSFVWRKVNVSVPGDGVPNKAVYADDRLVWLINAEGELDIAESSNGESWTEADMTGLPPVSANFDIEHAQVCRNEVCIMDGMDLYVSRKGLGWEKTVTTSETGFLHLLFSLKGDLFALGQDSKLLKLNGSEWREVAQLDSRFPVRGEAVCLGLSPTGTERVYIFGGIDADGNYLDRVYSSENGLYWVNLTYKSGFCTPRAYASLAQYGSGLLMIGGTTRDSLCEDNYLFSRDYGMTWMRVDTAFSIDTLITPELVTRTHASLISPGDGRLFLLGGRNTEGYIGDLWRGVQYSLLPGFKK